MKAFWDDKFYDMDECGMSRKEFADTAGETIRHDFDRIENAIRTYDLQKALKIIEECKQEY